MERYKNLNGYSGVIEFAIEESSIIVTFRHGGTYLYSYDVPGRADVEAMKLLALQGSGLATYINKRVRKRFAAKL